MPEMPLRNGGRTKEEEEWNKNGGSTDQEVRELLSGGDRINKATICPTLQHRPKSACE